MTTKIKVGKNNKNILVTFLNAKDEIFIELGSNGYVSITHKDSPHTAYINSYGNMAQVHIFEKCRSAGLFNIESNGEIKEFGHGVTGLVVREADKTA